MTEKRSITTWMPTFEDARQVLRVLDDVDSSQWQSLNRSLTDTMWKPEHKGIWGDPDSYIPRVLSAEDQYLANRIWREANVRPHLAETSVSLAQRHQLAVFDKGRITLTEAGKSFLSNDESAVAKIDRYEGISSVLHDVAERGPGGESLFLDSFREFLHQHTTFSPKKSGFQVLRTRLICLRQRGLIARRGKNYQVSDAGIGYLARWPATDSNSTNSFHAHDQDSQIIKLKKQKDAAARRDLAQHLSSMDPYKFEHLIKYLLEVMGYENVEVTSGSNDKGVDVVGEIELGISRVREVIQVKRQQSNVGRVILDSLRGSLHRFDAVRATIITTSGFSQGATVAAFEKGASPITLIDGERLLDLLIQEDIGIRRRELNYIEFDMTSLKQFETETIVEPMPSGE